MTKKLTKILFLILVTALVAAFSVTVAFAAENTTEFIGRGTELNPYLIITKEDLNNVRNYPSAHFKLMLDIVFTDADFAEGGAYYRGWTPIGHYGDEFTGSFNGNGHTISGLYINTSADYVGLFGYAYTATIRNLGMIDSEINATRGDAGGIVGRATGSNIENCYNTGCVVSKNSAGGIVGFDEYSIISSCYNTGRIQGDDAGGIVGWLSDGVVANCYNTGAIVGDYAGGGIVGSPTDSTISNCYNTGSISGSVGGGVIVGWNIDETLSISNCYYLDSTAPRNDYNISKMIKCSASQMQNQNTFAGFDFNATWTMEGNADYLYPELKTVPMAFTKALTSFEIAALPTKLIYLEATGALDTTGGKLTLYYDTGISEIIDMTAEMVSGFDNTQLGKQVLTVTYGQFTDSFEVEIIAKTLASIAVTTLPTKLNYIESKDTLDVAGGKLTLYYNNGTSEVIDMTAEMVSGFDNTAFGKQALTVTYGQFADSFEVEIIAKTLASIAVKTLPTKLDYLEAKESLDVTGGKLTLYYNNGTFEVIDMTAEMVSGFDNTKIGKQVLTVTYKGKTTTFKVRIESKDFSGGIGTAEFPYLIATKSDLNNVRKYLSAHFRMTADIVFTEADFAEGGAFYNDGAGWTPLGDDYDDPFIGTFDGAGHTVAGLYINITSQSSSACGGLFCYTKGATIKNLGLVDSEINVTVSSGHATAGGIVAHADSDRINPISEIINCYNTGSVTATGKDPTAGGIVGYVGSTIVRFCYNTGNITAAGNNAASMHDSYAGGIAGEADCLNGDGYFISYSYNTGNVNAGGNYTTSSGGIVGHVDGFTIFNCNNSGSIIADDNGGGIVGDAREGGGISNCYNTGNITALFAGGIYGSSYITSINGCYNLGKINGSMAGGIAGDNNSSSISNCYNAGNVGATNIAGGIVGMATNNISSCYNIGNVSGRTAGGIAGFASGVTLSNCYYLDNCSNAVGYGSATASRCNSEQMKLQSTFSAFDFDTIWTIDEESFWPYPQLKAVPMVPGVVDFQATINGATVNCKVCSVLDYSFTLTVAQYDANGRMIAVKPVTVFVLAGEEQTLDFSFTARDGATYKVFVTDSSSFAALDSCIPLG